MNIDLFLSRRTGEMDSGTRSEILLSIAAAIFFVTVIGWRFASTQERVPQLGFAAVIAWVLITLYWFRDRVWPKVPARGNALASTGLEYYRKELERRRDHLRNAWLWHGPLFLACLTFFTTVIGRAFRGSERLRNALPLVVLLVVWLGFSITRRRLQANVLQREIDDIAALGAGHGGSSAL